jgi:hypothetical protein
MSNNVSEVRTCRQSAGDRRTGRSHRIADERPQSPHLTGILRNRDIAS